MGDAVCTHVDGVKGCDALGDVGLEIVRAHRKRGVHCYIGHHADCESFLLARVFVVDLVLYAFVSVFLGHKYGTTPL